MILVVALVLRLGFIVATPGYHPKHDDRDYDHMACGIVNTGDYPKAPSRLPPKDSCGNVGNEGRTAPVAFRPPALPYLLAGTYIVTAPITRDRITAARVMLALVGALLVLLTGMVAARIWGPTVALVSMGLTAAFPPLVIVGGSLLSEVPFAALCMGSVLLVLEHLKHRPTTWRSWWLVGAGVTSGLSWLMRGNGIIVLLILAAAVWAKPRLRLTSPLPAAVLLVSGLLTVVPWTTRNAVELHHFVPIYMSYAALAGNYNPDTYSDPMRPGAWRMPSSTRSLAPLVRKYSRNMYAMDQAFLQEAIDFVKAKPQAPVVTAVHNTERLFMLGGGGPTWNRFSLAVASEDFGFAEVTKWSMWIYGLIALIGLACRATWRSPWWFWLVPLSAFLVAALLCSEIRYAVPFMPWMAILGAITGTSAAIRARAIRHWTTANAPGQRGR